MKTLLQTILLLFCVPTLLAVGNYPITLTNDSAVEVEIRVKSLILGCVEKTRSEKRLPAGQTISIQVTGREPMLSIKAPGLKGLLRIRNFPANATKDTYNPDKNTVFPSVTTIAAEYLSPHQPKKHFDLDSWSEATSWVIEPNNAK